MEIGLTPLRELTVADVKFTLECLPEDASIEGNASARDPETDRETERWIRKQLASGNEWAWCTAKVVCSWEGFHAAEYLGCCSYESEQDFRDGGYFSDLCKETLARLNEQIAQHAATLNKLAEPKRPVPTYEQITKASRVQVTRHLGSAQRISELLTWDPDRPLMGAPGPIAVGEIVRVLHVIDYRSQGRKHTDTFGEFKALIYTADYRAAWVMPYQIDALSVSIPDLNGARIVYCDDGETIHIPLPRELWRPTFGGCCCKYCSDDVHVHKQAYWDTLALRSTPKSGKPNTTWLVHVPALHGIEPKRPHEAY